MLSGKVKGSLGVMAGVIVLLAALIVASLPTHQAPPDSDPRNPPPPGVPASVANQISQRGPAQQQSLALTNNLRIQPDAVKADTLLARIQQVRQALTNMEARVYGADPALKAYENYRDVPDEWAQNRGLYHLWSAFAEDPSLDAEARKRRNRALEKLGDLLKAIAMKEMISNGFKHLYLSVFSKSPPEERVRMYERAISLAGQQNNAKNQAPSSVSAEDLIEFLSAKYPTLLDEANRLCQEHGIPSQVYEAVRVDAIGDQLTALVDAYVMIYTPSELRALRSQLRRLETEQQNAEVLRRLRGIATN